VTDTQPKQPERTLPELISTMGTDLSTLMHQELELAKEEIRVEVAKATKAGGAFGGAAGAGFYAGIALVITLGLVLDVFLWAWLAFLIVTVVLGAIAAVLAVQGKKTLDTVNPTPEKTIQTLKDDAQWLSEQTN
jgi:F0F1-type ATP synthase assembly protein I